MTDFWVDTGSMRARSDELDQLAQTLSSARGEAAVTVPNGAFGRLPESSALHAAFRLCTGRVTSSLDEASAGIAAAADGVEKVAHNYDELDRRGAERFTASYGNLLS